MTGKPRIDNESLPEKVLIHQARWEWSWSPWSAEVRNAKICRKDYLSWLKNGPKGHDTVIPRAAKGRVSRRSELKLQASLFVKLGFTVGRRWNLARAIQIKGLPWMGKKEKERNFWPITPEKEREWLVGFSFYLI